MTREEAINEIKSWDFLEGKEIEAIHTLIPELKESEDERIRRKMIEHFKAKTKDTWCNMPVKDIIAYLEKQKEHHLELNAGKWYICHRAFCARADHLTVKEGERFQCEKDGIVKGFVIKEPEKYFKECSAPEPMEKEQKPVESISQQTVQGKGVYKICPRCKERMIRDDSMVYTSMPPQYRYECPKCGESECDTVMYDSPETEEQKPAEWSEEDKEKIVTISEIIEHCTTIPYSGGTLTLNKEYKKELLCFIRTLRPSWKPSKEQMVALNALNCHGDLSYIGQQNQLISLYNDLKKLM